MSCSTCELRWICQRILREGGNPVLLYAVKKCHKIRAMIKKLRLLKRGKEVIVDGFKRKNPPTWGQEIEVYKDYVDPDFIHFSEKYMGGYWDGSDPLPRGGGEYALGSSILECTAMMSTLVLWLSLLIVLSSGRDRRSRVIIYTSDQLRMMRYPYGTLQPITPYP